MLINIILALALRFDYEDIGTMAVIGRNSAVAHLLSRWSFTGFPAWLLWLVVHLLRLIGFRNRLVVLINWAWDYLFYKRVIRLILPRKTRPVSEDRFMTTPAIPKSG